MAKPGNTRVWVGEGKRASGMAVPRLPRHRPSPIVPGRAALRNMRRHRGKRMGLIERLKGDVTFLRGALRALRMTTPIAKHPTRVFTIVVEELAEKFGDAPALLSAREHLSYRELSERANRYARWARAQNLAKGETVCLLMPNRPEYMAIWLGITSVGGVVALVNTN